MLCLPAVFSSHALFQQNSQLTIHGKTDAVTVTVRLLSEERIINEVSANAEDGNFSLSLFTPAASFRVYAIEISAGEDTLLLNDILFGELWLASGQSNMSFANSSMPNCEEFLDEMKNVPIRYYHQHYPTGRNAYMFPRQPSDELGGEWSDQTNRAFFRDISAVGTGFMKELSHYFRARIPVGILNASWGGTPILGWIPEEAVVADSALCEKITKYGLYPQGEQWNTKGAVNYQQPFAMYNCKIAPLLGVRIRGVIWYQGENDCGGEFSRKIYAQYLRCYHRAYARLFAATPESFMMISSLLYPWAYGWSGETNRGYLNSTFVETAIAEPHKFSFTPITDLPSIWSYFQFNHPIHPANKYNIGYRLALLAETNSYGRGSQRMPATLDTFDREEDRIVLRFRHASSGLHIEGNHIRGMYIAGKNNLYVAAECEILAPDTLAVYHPFLKNPQNVAYDYSSMEEGVNLFAGEFPVAPFITDTENRITIEQKPWLDLNRQSVWDIETPTALFYRPVWKPMENTEICTDTSFTKGKVSLRVIAEKEGVYGVTVKAHRYSALDLYNYKSLRINFMNVKGLTAKLAVRYAGKEETIMLPFQQIEALDGQWTRGWAKYEVNLETLPAGEIQSMSFVFVHSENPLHFVNLENPILVPKED